MSCFGTDDLYAILEVDRNGSMTEIKRGYYKLSLIVHPDRVSENRNQEATEKFQTLGKIYAVLSNEETRAIYDETGEIDDESSFDEIKDWNAYWRLLYPSITTTSIKNYEKKYKGSSEEVDDLKHAYEKFQGDMDKIMQHVIFATLEDEERFRNILHQLIKDEQLPAYFKFTNESRKKKQKRRNWFEKEAKEAEQMKLEMDNPNDSLQQLIQKRQKNRVSQMDDFFNHLEEKYCNSKSKSKPSKKKSDDQSPANADGAVLKSKKTRIGSRERK